jgi:hypothetical protein
MSWTGTRTLELVGDGLPNDPLDALAELNRRHEDRLPAQKRTEYTPEIVARVWQWAVKEFDGGADLEEIPVGKLVELYLDS